MSDFFTEEKTGMDMGINPQFCGIFYIANIIEK